MNRTGEPVHVEATKHELPQTEHVLENKLDARRQANSVRRKGTRRIIGALTVLTLTACQIANITDGVVASTQVSASDSTPTTLPLPTLTPFQPSTMESPTQIIQPVIESTIPIPIEATATSFEPLPDDPYFVDKTSYILKNPTELIYTKEQMELVANYALQRFRELGLTQDSGGYITAELVPPGQTAMCEANSYARRITCNDSDYLFNKSDVSRVIHELLHILENDSPTFGIGELRATVGAYLLSGRNPYIIDRYLFVTSFDVDGQPFYFSASDFVRGLEAQGVTEQELLQFVFMYEPNKDRIAEAAKQWIRSGRDMSGNAAFLIAEGNNDGFLSSLSEDRDGVNPFNGQNDRNSQFDACRVNSRPTSELLAEKNRTCLFID